MRGLQDYKLREGWGRIKETSIRHYTQLAATKPPPKKQAYSQVGSTANNERPSSRLRQCDSDTEDKISKLPPMRKNAPPAKANFGYSPDTAAEQMANQRKTKARDTRKNPTKTSPNNYIEVGMVRRLADARSDRRCRARRLHPRHCHCFHEKPNFFSHGIPWSCCCGRHRTE